MIYFCLKLLHVIVPAVDTRWGCLPEGKKALDLKIESFSVCQDILLLKGEGEVKLNMVMGKAELALRSYGAAGQEVVRSQLQEAEDAWATLLVAAMSCHR